MDTEPAPSSTGTRLLDAADVAEKLQLDRKQVYNLDIPRVRLTDRRVRWRLRDVEAYIDRRVEEREP